MATLLWIGFVVLFCLAVFVIWHAAERAGADYDRRERAKYPEGDPMRKPR